MRESLGVYHTHPSEFWHPRPAPYFGTLLDFAHLRLWEVSALFPEIFERIQGECSVVFVRDPMERFLSALHWHFDMRRALGNLSSEDKLELFRGFVSNELSPHRILTEPILVHFNRQEWFAALGNRVIVRHILPTVGNPLEAAQAVLGLPINTEAWREPQTPDPMLAEDRVLGRFVREYYAPDYDFLASLPIPGKTSKIVRTGNPAGAKHLTSSSL